MRTYVRTHPWINCQADSGPHETETSGTRYAERTHTTQKLDPRIPAAEEYAGKGDKTLSRDINEFCAATGGIRWCSLAADAAERVESGRAGGD